MPKYIIQEKAENREKNCIINLYYLTFIMDFDTEMFVKPIEINACYFIFWSGKNFSAIRGHMIYNFEEQIYHFTEGLFDSACN